MMAMSRVNNIDVSSIWGVKHRCGYPREHPNLQFHGKPYEWHLMTSLPMKMQDIAQLSIAHAHNLHPFGVTWPSVTSGSSTTSLRHLQCYLSCPHILLMWDIHFVCMASGRIIQDDIACVYFVSSSKLILPLTKLS